MRRFACLLVLLSAIVFAPPALAEEVEMDGFSVKLPPGYKKLADMKQSGVTIQFPMAQKFGMSDTEMSLYGRGDPTNPDSMLVLMYAELDVDTGRLSSAEFAKVQDMLRAQLGDNVKLEMRTFQKEYDALVFACQLEDVPQAHGMMGEIRFVMVGCGDYVAYVGLLSLGEDLDATLIEMEWTAIVDSLHIDPPSNWILLMLMIGGGGLLLFFIARLLTRKPPQLRYASDTQVEAAARGGFGVGPYEGTTSFGEVPQMPSAERSLGTPPAQPAPPPVPAGLIDPTTQQVARPPLPASAQPPAAVPDTANGQGLKSTLPTSGRWSDQFGDKA